MPVWQRAAQSQLLRFVIVGVGAAATHWVVAVAAMKAVGLPPLWANVLGFALAFPVSFAGHHVWSFAGHNRAVLAALPRYAVVAISSFLGNEALYALLLANVPFSPPILLATTLVIVAVSTFLLSRSWAFARR